MNQQFFSLAQALDELLISKKKSNQRYSMRAMARDLELDQSNLSKMIKGKRKPTPSQLLKISKALNLSNEKIIHLFQSL